MKRILIVDDERRGRRVLQIMVEDLGFAAVVAENGADALARLRDQQIDLVLTDMKMPGMSGIDLLSAIREIDRELPVIILTAYGTVQTAVDAMKKGAFDYVLRPFDANVLEATIRRALAFRRIELENRFLREDLKERLEPNPLIGSSAAMARITELISKFAPTRSPVLITGETGTGKELVARAIHRGSPRSEGLFVAINCAAIPSQLLESELFGHVKGAFTGAEANRTGKFEVADGGTLFLDEIGDMPYELQAKLLRVLQEGVFEPVGSNQEIEVDLRVVSSTNRELPAAIREGVFREDLYYRLNVFQIEMPPLRDRGDDAVELAQVFLESYCAELGKPALRISTEAQATLRRYEWPGNVRELRNVMERAAVLCEDREIGPRFLTSLLPEPLPGTDPDLGLGSLEEAIEDVERRFILRALKETGDNKAQAARLLGVSERTLWYKLKKLGI